MANVPGVFEIDIDDDKGPGLGYGHGGLGGQYSQNGGPGGGSGASCAQDGEHAINLDIEIQVKNHTSLFNLVEFMNISLIITPIFNHQLSLCKFYHRTNSILEDLILKP